MRSFSFSLSSAWPFGLRRLAARIYMLLAFPFLAPALPDFQIDVAVLAGDCGGSYLSLAWIFMLESAGILSLMDHMAWVAVVVVVLSCAP